MAMTFVYFHNCTPLAPELPEHCGILTLKKKKRTYIRGQIGIWQQRKSGPEWSLQLAGQDGLLAPESDIRRQYTTRIIARSMCRTSLTVASSVKEKTDRVYANRNYHTVVAASYRCCRRSCCFYVDDLLSWYFCPKSANCCPQKIFRC